MGSRLTMSNNSTSNEESFIHMQVEELAQVLNDKTHVVVDIRDAGAFASGRITDAQHLTNESLADFLREADPDAPVVVCCYHGHSSQQAAQFLPPFIRLMVALLNGNCNIPIIFLDND